MKKILLTLIILVLVFTFSAEGSFAAVQTELDRQVITSIQPGNHKFTVAWTRDPHPEAKYEIQIAADSSFKPLLHRFYRKNYVTDLTKINLENGKKYYMRVRTYIKENGGITYGRWSLWGVVRPHSTAVFPNTTITGVPEVRVVKKQDDGDILVLVNKYYGVSDDYYPRYMVKVPSKYGTYTNIKLKEIAYNAYKKMYAAAKDQGLNFKICSAYRSKATQRSLFNNYRKTRGLKVAYMLSAYPGRSEHHTGLAVDLLTGRNGWAMDESFANTKEGKWLVKHCAEYGFILRYPKGKSNITGYVYEPWHFRYVGKKAAKEIMSQGITLEEYLKKLPPK